MGITQSALNVLYVSVVDQGDTPPTWLSFPTMASSEEMAPVVRKQILVYSFCAKSSVKLFLL